MDGVPVQYHRLLAGDTGPNNGTAALPGGGSAGTAYDVRIVDYH